MIEDMEFKLRTTIETIYFGKTKDIVNELRQATSVGIMKEKENVVIMREKDVNMREKEVWSRIVVSVSPHSLRSLVLV